MNSILKYTALLTLLFSFSSQAMALGMIWGESNWGETEWGVDEIRESVAPPHRANTTDNKSSFRERGLNQCPVLRRCLWG